jgi:AbiU2
MVIALGRVFDSNKRNVSIAGLLKAEPDLEKVEKNRLERVQRLWKEHACHLRHEVVAHRSGTDTIEDAFKCANISLNDIGELIGLSRQLLDAWARIPNLNCFSHNHSSVKPDLKYLLGTLLGTRIERHAREKLQTVRARKAKIKKDVRLSPALHKG